MMDVKSQMQGSQRIPSKTNTKKKKGFTHGLIFKLQKPKRKGKP